MYHKVLGVPLAMLLCLWCHLQRILRFASWAVREKKSRLLTTALQKLLCPCVAELPDFFKALVIQDSRSLWVARLEQRLNSYHLLS